MNYPKYNVNISYVPSVRSGMQFAQIAGETQSVPTYSSDYYVASMPEIKLSASGSTYNQALTNLINLATASSYLPPVSEPLSITRNY
jgi:hypothetical protein